MIHIDTTISIFKIIFLSLFSLPTSMIELNIIHILTALNCRGHTKRFDFLCSR